MNNNDETPDINLDNVPRQALTPSRTKRVPEGWDDDLPHGVSRNQVHLSFIVRLSVQGKQLFITETTSRAEAARVYDLTVWLFLPKLNKMKKTNAPDDFPFITLDAVQRECPKLIGLYNGFPYLSAADSVAGDDNLRDQLIDSGKRDDTAPRARCMKNYNESSLAVQRVRRDLTAMQLSVDASKLRLAHVHKLPALKAQFEQAKKNLDDLSLTVGELCTMLDSQRDYYQKIAKDDDEKL